MDGLEWKRSKYSKSVQKFLKHAEKLAIKSSDYLIADSIGIQNYLKQKYDANSKYIAYGAELFVNPNKDILKTYNLEEYSYNLLIARLEPENNIETILDGVANSTNKAPFLVIGKHDVNKFGAYLKNKFKNENNIHFIGGIYNIEHLNNLRYYSNLYFHGHSVGGTNPSLLEAIASKALIIANDNEFNRAILKENAFYFSDQKEVKNYLETLQKNYFLDKIENGFTNIRDRFNWDYINNEYLTFFNECKSRN
jgi:hypothetical protein